jgi:hypothetical protein
MIEMISPTEFRLKEGCHEMTLLKSEFGWDMLTNNPSTRAWNSVTTGGVSMPGCRSFKALQEVEQHYKSWRGIAAIVVSLDTEALLHRRCL